MKVTLLTLLLVSLVQRLDADSRGWPPGALLLGSCSAAEFFVFEPVLSGSNVVKTKVLRFIVDDQNVRHQCDLNREVNMWLEPAYAFTSVNRERVVLISQGLAGYDSYAVAVFDFRESRYLFKRDLDEIFPSRKTGANPSWLGSTSTTNWIREVTIDKASSILHIITERSQSEKDEKVEEFSNEGTGPAYDVRVDLSTLEVKVDVIGDH